MNTFSSSTPLLHPITLGDWLEKLGEKALLAWLQFHSWKAERSQEHQPFCFRYSLNQIIKKLKIGKATFYRKVLEPLIQYGLIDLKPTENANRETHLVLYSFPQNCREKALLPLNPVQQNEQIHDEEELLPTIAPDDDCPPEPASETFSPTPEPTPPKKDRPFSKMDDLKSIDSLPDELKKPILADPKLIEYVPAIIGVYKRLHEHPGYSHPSFLSKLYTCIKYAPNKKRFAAYFEKALLNEWNKLQHQVPSSPSQPSPHRSLDVPIWIWEQQERQKQGLRKESSQLNSDQQSIIDELLEKIGRFGHENK